MRSHKVTIIDVAKEAGVSIASVSRFLHNPLSLKRNNREKISQAIKKLNYEPQVFAQRLAGGKLNTLGLVIPGYEGIFYSFYALEIIRNVGIALEKIGYDLHLNIYRGKDNLRTSLVDGVIFADIINNDKQLLRLFKEGIPTVVINKKLEEQKVSFVAIDNFKGAVEATEFLISHGHKIIAHIGGDLKVQCAYERLSGYKFALEKNGLPIDEKIIKLANFSPLEARKCLEELLALSQKPTAIFCASDEMAQEVLHSVREKGINVPRNLSIIGFDDNPRCIYDSFGLTTVRQPLDRMAQLGVDILMEIVEKKDTTIKKIILEPELVIRDSVSYIN
ncbi:MAG: LacI family transcriptional regulator [Candidatus Omnitrophica bacterium]|nr:LacI family transcriptional regulator [Candidatus Omnitrophota bacterium]MCM8826001.1 LacI family transcriptional regulator [Candidatus Omnitrophota bacterium]